MSNCWRFLKIYRRITDNTFSLIIVRMLHSGRYDCSIIMVCHFLVGSWNQSVITGILGNTGFEIIRD